MKDPNFEIAFTIGKYHIYWYAILLALGIAAAVGITDRRARGRQLPKDIALDLCILGVPFGILGARLFACLSGAVAWETFFDLTRSGLSFFGGIIFASLAMLVYLKLRKADVGELLDAAVPGALAGIAIAVWGDFFSRTNYGPLVERAAHKWFPLATFGDDLKIHYAAFFYEFLLCVILIVLYYTLLRKRMKGQEDRFLLMALLYLLGRFLIDSIRQGLIMVGPFAFDQICEMVLAAVCLCLLLLKRTKKGTDAGMEEAPAPMEAEAPPMSEEEEDAAGPKSEADVSGLD